MTSFFTKILRGEGPSSLDEHPSTHQTSYAGWAFTALALFLWFMVRNDYGVSWDQSVDLRFGQAVFRYFTEGFHYERITEYPVANLKFYSPLVALLASWVAATTGANLFSCGAAIIGLFWVATFWPVCQVAKILGGSAASWLAGLALLAMPTYMGHGFINAKDLPFAAAVAWFLLAILWSTKRRHLRWLEIVVLGLAFGMVLAVRPGGFFVGALFFVPLFEHGVLQKPLAFEWPKFLKVGLLLGLSVVLAWIVMIAPWPSAHKSPLWHPFESMILASKFHEAYPVLFQGAQVQSNKLPWNYFFVYFGLTIPPLILLGTMIGQARLVVMTLKGSKRSQPMALLFLIWFPLLAFLVLRMNVYDGIRHFLFLLPLFAISAAIGGARLAGMLPKSLGILRGGAMAVAFAISIPSLWSLHPYQYSYYNLFAGPRGTLHQRFETDYWVTSYREAAEWVRNQEVKAPRVVLAANAFSEPAFLNFSSPDLQFFSVLSNLKNEPWPDGADFYVGTVRYGQSENFSSTPIVFKVERDGILMSVIRSPKPQSDSGLR